MIRHGWDEAAILAQIQSIDAKWLQKAQRRTTALLKAGTYSEKTAIWSSVKEVFMRLQANKCVFCERQFENPEYGKIEFDLEHFRPKSSVEPWPHPTRHAHLQYGFSTGNASATGYYWLAYDLKNYAASCKVCNTTFKSNYFPVEHVRSTAPGQDLDSENAYLCYPLGDGDADPQDLITFSATTAVPVAHATPEQRRRAQVIIDFFGLNVREQLHRERARMISLFGAAFAARHAGQASGADLALIAKLPSAALPHANCLRAFQQAWMDDPALAGRIYEVCRAYAVDQDSRIPPTV